MVNERLVEWQLLIKRVSVVLTILSLVTVSACFEPLRVEVTEANPPKFVLHGGGSGYIGSVRVSEVLDEYGSHKDIWLIGPTGSSEPLSHFYPKEILYGKVPEGWHEEIPRTNQDPPTLKEGRLM